MAPLQVAALLGAMFFAGAACTRDVPSDTPAPGIRRPVLTREALPRAVSEDEAVYVSAHRIVYEIDPPLAPGVPNQCAVADEFRLALGCLESLPLGPDETKPRPTGGTLRVEGDVPRRYWGDPMLIEPRVRGEAIAGFKPTSPEILESGFFGFAFDTELPPLDGEGELEVQLRGYVVPPSTQHYVTTPIAFDAGDVLSFGVALNEIGRPFMTSPVEFIVSVLSDAGERDLFTSSLDPATWTGGWIDHRVDLGDLAGTTGRLRFETTSKATAFPLWGAPEVLRRTSRDARRNVILISLDTWRHDHFDTNVSGGPVTPRLAELARRGVVFDHAITTYPSTSASHMSLFTGRYPITHQVRFANDVLGPAIPTLAEILAARGYQTGAVTENAMLLAETGFMFGFDSYFENKGLGIWSTEGQIDSTLARGRRWLRDHANERFFLFLHTYQIHTPYEPPDEYVFGPTQEELASSDEPKWVATLRHRYAGEVRYADMALAAFLEDLEETGMLENSIVVLTSDHGEEFAEHDRVGHSKSVYDEVLRVPLLVWAPGLVHEGVRVDTMVSLIDVVPTLLDLLEIAPPDGLQGRTLRAALRGEALAAGEPLFAEGPDLGRPGKRLLAARTDRHKWIARQGAATPHEIYDLVSDPKEAKNVDDDSLREIGRHYLAAYGALAGGASPKRDLDARTTEKLRALGYVE